MGGMDADARVERNGKRRRVREAERVSGAIHAVTQALQPLDLESRGRVLRAVAVLLDIEPPRAIGGETFAGG